MSAATSRPGCSAPHAAGSGDDAERTGILRDFGATASEAGELLAYTGAPYPLAADLPRCPMPDEPFVGVWQDYVDDARRSNGADALRSRLIQLRFPVAAGTSERPDYQAATRRGVQPAVDTGPRFEAPERIRLFLHQTAAGRIPVIVAGARADFVTLTQALTRRNETTAIPDSMGACVVAGYNNWDRIASYRRFWAARRSDTSEAAWTEAFALLLTQRERYQDRFIILSEGNYSAVASRDVGLPDDAWLATSLQLRLEHEGAHYFTRRAFGVMRNALFDELIADYIGIVAANGAFRADWLLRFLGLESHPRYRAGGRLQNYRGTPPLSDGAFAVLRAVVVAAAHNLERFDGSRARRARGLVERALTIAAMARIGFERLAAPGAPERLASELAELERTTFTS